MTAKYVSDFHAWGGVQVRALRLKGRNRKRRCVPQATSEPAISGPRKQKTLSVIGKLKTNLSPGPQ